DDWPYERCPLAAACAPGWQAVGAACQAHGAVVLAGLGHSGGQGSGAYSQTGMGGPARGAGGGAPGPPPGPRQAGLGDVVAAFAAAARVATTAGLDGVEVDSGPWSLLRQFQSGLTNQRSDGYGADRLRLTREILAAVRQAIGHEAILALRLSCDELAPWAGIT